MNFRKRLISSVFISVAVFISSLILPVIPCRVAPLVPNSSYQWTFCNLNPDSVNRVNSIKEYFGYTTNLTDAYFITLIIVFVAAMVFFHFTARRKQDKRR